MKKNIVIILLIILIFTLTGCKTKQDVVVKIYPFGSQYPINGTEEDYISSSSNQLLCCVYSDNEHYSFWQDLINCNSQNDPFYSCYKTDFISKERIRIHIDNAIGARVDLLDDEDNVIFTSIVDKMGYAYLYTDTVKDRYPIRISYVTEGDANYTNVFRASADQLLYLPKGQDNDSNLLELMLVIDGTGSSLEELNYVKNEMENVIDSFKELNANAKIRVSVMLYRDENDEYITKYSGFTTNIDSQIEYLNEQESSGGGDYAEAVDVAMMEAVSKEWQAEYTTKIIMHFGDAPVEGSENSTNWYNATKLLAEKGIKIISIVPDCIDKQTELYFRSEALITGGSYVFMTSAINGRGILTEQTIEEKPTIEYLSSALVRLLDGYYNGNLKAPVYYKNEGNND